jgi:2-polyprenyl-6-hydroxyphenyl methylase/3-demethylubiquinone-9 3-methyltransferase
MQGPSDLKDVETHFAFGENWASYSKLIGDAEITAAEQGLVRLLGQDGLRGRSFIDVGCGSGLHALAALRLGARRVLAVDIDADSTRTTASLLRAHAPAPDAWAVRTASVFDLDPARDGTFDFVYAWGVLHHTGAMREAVRNASRLVAAEGVLCVALYGWTPFCRLWTLEKRFYARAKPDTQRALRRWYVLGMRGRFLAARRDFASYVAGYKTRGMDFEHDVHDWLGGYPYESAKPVAMRALLRELGFAPVREFVQRRIGVFGSGCDEYVYRRVGSSPEVE